MSTCGKLEIPGFMWFYRPCSSAVSHPTPDHHFVPDPYPRLWVGIEGLGVRGIREEMRLAVLHITW